MDEEDARSIKIFCSYAHKDEELKEELLMHLGNRYPMWHDRDINGGADWAREIDTHLNRADIILLLISVYFMNSNYCKSIEMVRALERQASGDAEVIPIILRPVNWDDAPFKDLLFLPPDGRPVTDWPDHHKPLADVARGVVKTANVLLEKRKKIENRKQLLSKAEQYVTAEHYEAALHVYDDILQLFPMDPSLYKSKGDALLAIARSEKNESVKEMYFKEAAGAFEQAIKLSPAKNAEFYMRKGDALFLYAPYTAPFMHLSYQEALGAYEEAITITSGNALLYEKKGNTLYRLHKYVEAAETYQQAIDYEGGNAQLWRNKADALAKAQRFYDAYNAYIEAIRFDPKNPYLYKEAGDVLFERGEMPQAIANYTKAIQYDENYILAYRARIRACEELAQNDRKKTEEGLHPKK